jgi:hypothetical protein
MFEECKFEACISRFFFQRGQAFQTNEVLQFMFHECSKYLDAIW